MTAGTVHAQHVNIGTKIGLNSYSINNDSGSNFDSKLGIHAGIFGHAHLTRQLGFQPELVYSTQGGKTGNTDFNLDYINVPVLLQYMFDNGFRVQAGPQVGFLVRAKAKNGNSTLDVKDQFKTIDAGLSFGASYIHVPSSFGIDARYNLGLRDISEVSGPKFTNRGLQVGIFYLFGNRN
ncbi:MAG: porin family protein [Cyclonatronaceae bacterium]